MDLLENTIDGFITGPWFLNGQPPNRDINAWYSTRVLHDIELKSYVFEFLRDHADAVVDHLFKVPLSRGFLIQFSHLISAMVVGNSVFF